MRTRGEKIGPDTYEYVLTLTVTATVGGKTLFLVETSQAGIFAIRGIPPDQLQPVMASQLSECVVSVCTRNDCRCDDARRIPSGSSRADQFRDALPGATRATASARGHELKRRSLKVFHLLKRAVKRRPFKTLSLVPTLALSALLAGGVAGAADYKTTSDAPTLLYDAPSTKARPLFVYGRDVPVEVLVSVEGWTKTRDVSGAFGWISNKSLADKRMLLVRVPIADIRANPDDASPVVFRAEQNVLLDLAESATSPGTTATPGWVKVRHRDGQSGYARVNQVFGL